MRRELKTIVAAGMVGAALALAAPAQAASLVTNGGFETGLTGWSCSTPNCFTGVGGGVPVVEGVAYFSGFDNGAGGDLTQILATDVGTIYNITFIFNTNGSVPPNALTVDVGDLSADLNLAQGVWNTFTGAFTASSTSTLLDFGFSTVDGRGTVSIDAVAVEVAAVVPTPQTALLVGLGLLGLGFSRRRK